MSGIPIIGDLLETARWAFDKITEYLQPVYDYALWFTSTITGTFHYDNGRQILALSFLFLVSLVVIFGLIGGGGIHGQEVEGTGGMGLNDEGIPIGSDATTGGIGKTATGNIGWTDGVKDLSGLTTTTIETGDNGTGEETTTTTINTLICTSHSDCDTRRTTDIDGNEINTAYCCPQNTGNCAGYCVFDACEYAGHDNIYADGQCFDSCGGGMCYTSDTIVYPRLPYNNSLQNNTLITFRWGVS